MALGPVAQTLHDKLTRAFQPVALEIVDESARHHGHAGANPAGESHFRLRIRSACFAGKSRVERHRMVNAVLAEELKGRVHALAIEAEEG